MRHGDAVVEPRRHRLLARKYGGLHDIPVEDVLRKGLGRGGNEFLDGLLLGVGLELGKHGKVLDVACGQRQFTLRVGFRLCDKLRHVLLLEERLRDGLGEFVHLAYHFHPRLVEDALLRGRAVDADGIARALERQFHVVHRDFPDAQVGLVRVLDCEEALAAEFVDELAQHDRRHLVVGELEADLARICHGRLGVTHTTRLREEEPHEGRRRHHRRDERHENADSEDLLRKIAVGETETGDDEGHFAARHHAGADADRAEQIEPAEQRGKRAADDLGQNGEGRVDETEVEDRLGGERRTVHHHAHHAEEDRHEERVDGGERFLDEVLEIRPAQRKARHVGADDHGEAHVLEEPGEDHGKSERKRGDGLRVLEELQQPGDLARDEYADERGAEPHAECLHGHHADCTPVHAGRGRAAGGLGREGGGDDAVADREDDEAKHVVDDRAGHDRDAFLGIHLLAFGENARRDADRGRRRHDAHVHRGRLHPGAGERQLGQIAELRFEELRQQIDGAEVAEDEREDDAADADHEADERILDEHLQVRLQAGEEEKDDGRQCRDAVERRARRVEHGPAAGHRAKHRLHGRGRAVGQERRPVDRPERAAVEKTVLEDSVAEADAAKRPRANHDAGRQFTENGGQLEQRSHHASQLCGENDDADLQHQKHHFLDTRHVEVRIGRNGIPCQGRHGG